MNDRDEAFDLYLREALAPSDRAEDVRFAARVQAVVALEDRWAANRRATIRRLVRELVAILAFGAAIIAASAAPSLSGVIATDRALVLTALILGFGMLVLVLAGGDSRSAGKPVSVPFSLG